MLPPKITKLPLMSKHTSLAAMKEERHGYLGLFAGAGVPFVVLIDLFDPGSSLLPSCHACRCRAKQSAPNTGAAQPAAAPQVIKWA